MLRLQIWFNVGCIFGFLFWACLKEARSNTRDNSNEDREICLMFCLPVKRPVGVGFFSESEATCDNPEFIASQIPLMLGSKIPTA